MKYLTFSGKLKIFFLAFIIIIFMCINLYLYISYDPNSKKSLPADKGEKLWNVINNRHFESRQLSILAQRLFLNKEVGIPKSSELLIYVYQFGPFLESRLINQFSGSMKDPFEFCSVKNCRITYNESFFHEADAVLFHMHKLKGPPKDLERKNINQRWVWMTDESVFNLFFTAKDKNLEHYDGLFNWSMSYRSDSDVPVPYGRTIPLANPVNISKNYFNSKRKDIAIMISACSNRNGRLRYVHSMEKYVNVDIYGRCGTLPCPGHFKHDCNLLNDYKFYLAFENSNCKEYITEKLWWNALGKGAVPIVMGPSKSDYIKLLPPHSFIHVDDYQSPKDLTEYIKFLLQNEEEYNKYHAWRSQYAVVNEHGYFQSRVFHYCRLCEALNYNDPSPKIYKDMKSFWNVERDCNLRVYA